MMLIDRPIEEWTFVLNQTGRKHIDCSSLEDLRDNLDYYGLPVRLAMFDRSKFGKDDYCLQNSYQNWTALAYPPDDED